MTADLKEQIARVLYAKRPFRDRPFDLLSEGHKKDLLDEVGGVVSAIEAAGYVVVPREPNATQVMDGDNAYVASTGGNRCYGGQDGIVVAYRAMVEAAKEAM